MIDLYLSIPIMSTVITILFWHFWRGHYYKNNKFKIFLTLITTITSIMFSAAIILQVYNYNHQQTTAQNDHYNSLSKIFLDDTIELFIQHPEMNYYYEDLMGIKAIDNNTKRNIVLEEQISMLIFSRLAKFAIFIQNSDPQTSSKIEKWMGHVTHTFMKSPTLRYYWIHQYKPNLSGPASIKYMKDNYNL